MFVPATIQKRRLSPHGKLLRHNDSPTTAGLQVMYLLTTVGLQVMYLLCHNDSLTTVGLQVMLDSDCRAGVRSCNHSKTTALPPLQAGRSQKFSLTRMPQRRLYETQLQSRVNYMRPKQARHVGSCDKCGKNFWSGGKRKQLLC